MIICSDSRGLIFSSKEPNRVPETPLKNLHKAKKFLESEGSQRIFYETLFFSVVWYTALNLNFLYRDA